MAKVKKYVLGTNQKGKVVQYKNEKEADWLAEDWVRIYNFSLKRAKENYTFALDAWEKGQQSKLNTGD